MKLRMNDRCAGVPNAGAENPAYWYDGWSGFKILKNNEPPLVLAYSSPMKIKLTAEVPQSASCEQASVLPCAASLKIGISLE